MTKKTMSGVAAAFALMAAPAMAAPVANPAASLSVAKSVRTAAPSARSNKIAGSGGIIVAVLAAGVVIGGIIAVTNNDDDSDSN